MSFGRFVSMAPLALLVAGPVLAQSEVELPQPVSPHGDGARAIVETRCPTFSWSGVDWATGYELVVMRLLPDGQTPDPSPSAVSQVTLPGTARAWTPSLESCLEAGTSYAWSLRALGAQAPSDWSETVLFEVIRGHSIGEVEAALAVLRRFLSERHAEPGPVDTVDRRSAIPGGGSGGSAGGPAGREMSAAVEASPSPSLPVAGAEVTTGASAPDIGAPGLALDSQLHLNAGGELVKEGDLLLWDDAPGFQLALGRRALDSNTDGVANTAGGVDALTANSSGARNTAWGAAALLQNTTGSDNTALGTSALAGSVDASFNTAVGVRALFATTTGGANTAVGGDALGANTTGDANTAVGYRALVASTTGGSNTALGALALAENTVGAANTALGQRSLTSLYSGDHNTAVGTGALAVSTVGSHNTALGSGALSFGAASHSTAVGSGALNFNFFGSYNIALGAYAGANSFTGSHNIWIGNFGGTYDTHTLRIGGGTGTDDLQLTRAFISGIRGAIGTFDQAVCVDEDDQLGPCQASSRRFKEGIRALADESRALADLRPVRFRYKEDLAAGAARHVQYGLIAEEVAELYPSLVTYDRAGRPVTVRYAALVPLLLSELQRQSRLHDAHARSLADLRRLEAAVDELRLERRSRD